MNDRAALLAAILADPADDTVRLAFADWCEENGDPERAEFIRLLIGLARLPDRGSEAETLARFFPNPDAIDWSRLCPEMAGRAASRRRANALFDANKPRWFGWRDGVVVDDPQYLVAEFARGFPNWVTGSDFDNFRLNIAPILSQPITRLSVRLAEAEDPDDLLGFGILGRLSALQLDVREEVDAAEVVRRLGKSGQVRGLTELEVICRDLDPAPLVQALAETRGWSDIRRLYLGFWPDEEVWLLESLVDAIAAAPHLSRITELTLDAELRAGAVAALAKAYPGLESLAIRGLNVTAAFTLAHCGLPELRRLDTRLSDGGVVSAAVAGLLLSPGFPKLAVFPQGDHEPLTGLGAYLTDLCRGPALRYLNLRYSGIGPEDAVALARCPAMSGLVYLELEGNRIESAGAVALAGADWPRLACLKLHSCGIGEAGALALARAPMPELQHLDLAFNPLGPAGCYALVRGHFPQLRELNVRECGGGDQAATALRERFGSAVRV
jgi:uncharacterized protein (TIGR02996 family)